MEVIHKDLPFFCDLKVFHFKECGDWTKQVLDGYKVPYMEVDVSMMVDQLQNMYALSLGLNKQLPQLYFNNKIIGV